MPKRKSFNFKQLQGSSSSNPHSGRDGADKKPATVNERLGELRKLEARDAAQKKRELAEAVANHGSVPPSLQGIMGVHQSAPPKPKRGVRSRMPTRTPGPAPPESWSKRPALTPSLALRGGLRRFSKLGSADEERNRPKKLLRLARIVGLDTSGVDDKPASLLHICLKSAAEQWDLFDEDDLPALVELPLRLRLRLLSYIGFYGPPITISVLDALTQGSEPVTQLDLAGLIGSRTLKLHQVVKLMRIQSAEHTLLPDPGDVADSWDQTESFEAALSSQPSMSPFSQLTHLSLSHPAAGSSWRDMLSLTKHVPSLTHLSLAYWPRPTLTPNLATTTISSQHSPDVSAGGSHYYSNLDNDLSEPALILRQLSGSLLRLQWLDLEGCTEWIPALSFQGEQQHPSGRQATTAADDDDDLQVPWSNTSAVTSIFAHNWKNIRYINVSQGWLPSVSALRALPRQSLSLERERIVSDYTSNSRLFFEPQDAEVEPADPYSIERRKAEIWLQLEAGAKAAERTINEVRRRNACWLVRFDHGWERRAF